MTRLAILSRESRIYMRLCSRLCFVQPNSFELSMWYSKVIAVAVEMVESLRRRWRRGRTQQRRQTAVAGLCLGADYEYRYAAGTL